MFYAVLGNRKQGSPKLGLPLLFRVLFLAFGSLVSTQGLHAQYTQMDQVVRQVSQLRGELAYLAGEIQRSKNDDAKALDLNAMALRVSAAEAQLALVKSKADRLQQQINAMQAGVTAQVQKSTALERRILNLEQTAQTRDQSLAKVQQSVDVQRDVLKQGLLRLGSASSLAPSIPDASLIPSLTDPNGKRSAEDNAGLVVEASEFPESGFVGLDAGKTDFDDEQALRAFMQGREAAFDPYQQPALEISDESIDVSAHASAIMDASPETKEAIYQAALADFRSGAFSAAQSRFQAFLKAHENDTLAGNASYWLGESFYGEGDYTRAALQFSKGYATYRESPKAPDHLLKLGLALDKLDRRQEACASLLLLQEKAPEDRPQLRQKVEQELQRLRCV